MSTFESKILCYKVCDSKNTMLIKCMAHTVKRRHVNLEITDIFLIMVAKKTS